MASSSERPYTWRRERKKYSETLSVITQFPLRRCCPLRECFCCINRVVSCGYVVAPLPLFTITAHIIHTLPFLLSGIITTLLSSLCHSFHWLTPLSLSSFPHHSSSTSLSLYFPFPIPLPTFSIGPSSTFRQFPSLSFPFISPLSPFPRPFCPLHPLFENPT